MIKSVVSMCLLDSCNNFVASSHTPRVQMSRAGIHQSIQHTLEETKGISVSRYTDRSECVWEWTLWHRVLLESRPLRPVHCCQPREHLISCYWPPKGSLLDILPIRTDHEESCFKAGRPEAHTVNQRYAHLRSHMRKNYTLWKGVLDKNLSYHLLDRSTIMIREF